MPSHTPTRDSKDMTHVVKSPKSPHLSPRISPSGRVRNFSTPPYQPAKIQKFSPMSANKAITQAKKKRFNFENPKVKRLLDKLSQKSDSPSSNLNRLKRLLFRKKKHMHDKENMENTATEDDCYTYTDDTYYFGTEIDSDGELSEEELDFAFGLDSLDNHISGIMSPTKRSVMASTSSTRSSMALDSKQKFSLSHLFGKTKQQQMPSNAVESSAIPARFDIRSQLESDLSVADAILQSQWKH